MTAISSTAQDLSGSTVAGTPRFIPSKTESGRHQFYLGSLLALLVILAYAPVWHARFIWDDDVVFHFFDRPTWQNALYSIWGTSELPDYLPLTYTVCLIESRLFGANQIGYHVVNLLMHTAGVLLLWRVLMRLRVTHAWLVALLFGIHPLTVTTVAWAAEIKNTLSYIFYSLTVLFYLHWMEAPPGRGRVWYGLSLATFLSALLSKTSGVCLPLFLLACTWWTGRRVQGIVLLRMLPFGALAALFSFVTIWFQLHRALDNHVVSTDDFLSRLVCAGAVFWFYLGKALLPSNQMLIYPDLSRETGDVLAWIPDLLLLAGVVAAWRSRHRPWGRSALFALCFVLSMLLPVMGFIDMAFLMFSRVADQFVYLALAGFIALVVAGVGGVLGRFPLAPPGFGRAAAAAAVLLLGILTWNRASLYEDPLTLWVDNLRKNPQSWGVYKNIAQAFMDSGQFAEAEVWFDRRLHLRSADGEGWYDRGVALMNGGHAEAALRDFKRAVSLEPKYAKAHNNMGVVLESLHRDEEAVRAYQQATEDNENLVEPWNNLGNLLLRLGRFKRAEASYNRALALDSSDATTWCNLGALRSQQGHPDQAYLDYREAIDLRPDFAEAHLNLAHALLQLGRTSEAIAAYQNAYRLRPNDPDLCNTLGMLLVGRGHLDLGLQWFTRATQLDPSFAPAYNNMAILYATAADATFRNADRAIALARRALSIPHVERANALHTLAAGYAAAGRFSEAVRVESDARAACNPKTDPDLHRRILACLANYRKHRRE